MKICYSEDRKKTFFVDDEDYEKVLTLKCYVRKDKYVQCRNGGRDITLLHKVLMNVPSGMYVDHIDHNPSNNCKSNLRICSPSQNHMNQKQRPMCSSKYKGVTWYKRDSNWKAQIGHNNINYHIGYYNTQEEAALAYNAKAIEHFGEYALLNIITEEQ